MTNKNIIVETTDGDLLYRDPPYTEFRNCIRCFAASICRHGVINANSFNPSELTATKVNDLTPCGIPAMLIQGVHSSNRPGKWEIVDGRAIKAT